MTISTYLGYQLYARNPAQSLSRVASEPEVENDEAYYDANIGKVKSVDDFINNYRLFSYAMNAYGLSDLTYAKGLMKQVLTSNLSDPTSLANRLNDPRYLAFAKAFQFTTSGAVATTSVQSTAQQTATVEAFTANTASTLSASTSAQATSYYDSHIGAVTSLAGIEGDAKLYSYVLTAYGLNASTTTKAQFEAIVNSNIANPTSAVNTTTGSGYAALQGAVNVTASTLPAETAGQVDATVAAYQATVASDPASQAAAATETEYFKASMADMKSADNVVNDTRLVAYITKAFNLPSGTTSVMIQAALTSDLSDPTSFANTSTSTAYAQVTKAFNFDTDGTLQTASTVLLPAQTSAEVTSTVAAYQATVPSDSASQAAAATETAYYQTTMASVRTVDDVLNDPRLVAYVTKAFNLPSGTTSPAIRAALTSDLSNPASFANTNSNAAFGQLAGAFNFQTNGTLQAASTVVLPAQTSDEVTSTVAAYQASVPSNPTSQAAAAAETTYYRTTMATVTTADDVVNDARLVSYLTQAFNLPAGATSATIKSALTSDLGNPNSFANTTSVTAYRQLAASFNFKTDGTLDTTSVRTASTVALQAETAGQIDATVAAYQATVASDPASQAAAATETEYFKAAMADMTTAGNVVGDARLVSYLSTAFDLPSGTTPATIQAALTSDLNDPASFANTSSTAAFKQLAAAFNFKTNGTLNTTASETASTVVLPAQTSAQTSAAVAAYEAATASDSGAQTQAASETKYFETAMAKVTTVDDVMNDNRLVSYIIKAYGIPLTTSAATIRAALTSDLSNPSSFANTTPTTAYKQLAQGFNFKTDGTLQTTPFQTTSQVQQTVSLYTARQSSDTAASDSATAYYEANIGKVKTVADLEANSQLYRYVMTAYGIPSATAHATVEQVTDANPQSETGILGTTAQAHDLALNQAFSVDGSGNAANVPQVQGAAALADTTAAYMAAAKSDPASQTAAGIETSYYTAAIAGVTSVGALLGDSRLVAYIDTAFNMPTGTTTAQLRQVLTTSTTDAAKLNATDKKLWQAFNVDTTGLIKRQPAGQAQSAYATAGADAAYVVQQMDTEAGQQNTGVQLALYFAQKAPTITNAYSILADKALLQFTQTVLGLSSSSSNANIDVQAQYITSKLNLADLKNPTKLNQLVQRFAALYDEANPTGIDTVSLLFGGGDSSS